MKRYLLAVFAFLTGIILLPLLVPGWAWLTMVGSRPVGLTVPALPLPFVAGGSEVRGLGSDSTRMSTAAFSDGNVVVQIDNQVVLDYQISVPDYSYSGVGFSASTGLYTNDYMIDDFVLTVGDDAVPPAAIDDLVASTGGAAGTVNLSWTAPGDTVGEDAVLPVVIDDLVASTGSANGNTSTASTYILRYADSPIVSEFGWIMATDVPGELIPQPAGNFESMTVWGLVPGQIYYFAIRVLDEAGNLSGLSNSPSAAAKDISDLGFRPNPNGYRFDNMQLWRNEQMFEQFFGTQNVKKDGEWCTEARKYFFESYKPVAGRYSCLGFSLTSLLSYLGQAQPYAGPYAIDHFEQLYQQQRSEQLTNPIAYYAGVQTAQQWAANYFRWQTKCQTNPREMVETIRRGMDNHTPYVVSLKTPLCYVYRDEMHCVWHTVLPYRIDDISSTAVDVYVYDSERHGEERSIHFRDSEIGWRWEYTFVGTLSDVGTVRGSCSDTLPYSVTASLQRGIPPQDWCQSSTGPQANGARDTASSGRVLAHLPSKGDWVIQDHLGRQFGWVNGQFAAEIPDAYEIPQVLGSVSLPYRTVYLPEAEYMLRIASLPIGRLEYTIFGDGHFVSVSGYMRSDGAAAEISVAPWLDQATLSGLEDLTWFALALDNELPTESHLATITGGAVSGSEDLDIDFDGDQVGISRAGGNLPYTIRFDKNDGQLFMSEALVLGSNETHILRPNSWAELSSTNVVLEVDYNSDGLVDDTRLLNNQARRIYLPLVLRNSGPSDSGTPIPPLPLEDYRLLQSVVGSCGNSVSSANYRLNGTCGQVTVSDVISSTNYRISSGYWAGVNR